MHLNYFEDSTEDEDDDEDYEPCWHPVESNGLAERLRQEMCEGHILYGAKFKPIARRYDCDDVIFAVFNGDETSFALVHLTWSSQRQTDPNYPTTQFYPTLKQLLEDYG